MSAEEKSTNLTRLYTCGDWLCLNRAYLAVCALLLRDMPLGWVCAVFALSVVQLQWGRAATYAGRHSASPGGSAHACLAGSNAQGTWRKWVYRAGRQVIIHIYVF